jgi:hypothetical protein
MGLAPKFGIVADDDRLTNRRHFRRGNGPQDDLGTDAGRISYCDSNAWLAGAFV